MGFGLRWRIWVKECVTTASISVLINGSPSKPFKMERGLRQGDPLSPFLFVLVVDVLHRMVGEAVRNGRIFSLLVGRDNIELSHLQFADDTILFYPQEIIKSVLNSLPVYYLSLYKMPKAVAEKIIGLQRRFMWSKEDGNYGIPLVKWEVVQALKKLGGLEPDLAIKRGPWKDICQLNIKEQQVRDKMISGLSMEMENGRSTRFWEDAWLQGGSLKDSFPRLFSVSNQQGFVIGDCGFWDVVEWVLQKEILSEDIMSYSFTSSIWHGLVWCAWLKYADRAWAIILGPLKNSSRVGLEYQAESRSTRNG
ncbi:uncharacterized protein LOC107476066 [Arachis duranensis]|uniref:Uncharacterized protein LOC107476066 n=1 Tax=Arachis duranensis TaxID=130453 RepID=A0A6P4CGQ8_ARADU|nr:uncharacterized protein LOC107476066 [Arachis duranensis]